MSNIYALKIHYVGFWGYLLAEMAVYTDQPKPLPGEVNYIHYLFLSQFSKLILEAQKLGKSKDLSDLDKGQIVMRRQPVSEHLQKGKSHGVFLLFSG